MKSNLLDRCLLDQGMERLEGMMEESLVKEKKKVFLVSGWTNYSPAVEKAVEKLGGLISTLWF